MFKIRSLDVVWMSVPSRKLNVKLYTYNCLTLKALNLFSVIANQCVPKPCSVTFEQKEVSK